MHVVEGWLVFVYYINTKMREQGSTYQEEQTFSLHFCFSLVVYVYRSRTTTIFTIYYNVLPSGHLAKAHKDAVECNYKQVIAREK